MEKEQPLFIIDSSVLVKMFEGKNDEKAIDVINKFSEMKAEGLSCRAITTFVSFLNALWKANPKSKIKDIQSVMEVIDIIKTKETDYKNDSKVTNDLIEFAKFISDRKEVK